MVKNNTFSLDSFKDLLINDEQFKEELTGELDSWDFDNGVATVYENNLNHYLEKYACKNVEEFLDTMWYSYGMMVRIV